MKRPSAALLHHSRPLGNTQLHMPCASSSTGVFSSSQPAAALNASHASDGAVDLDCDGQEVNACGDGMDCLKGQHESRIIEKSSEAVLETCTADDLAKWLAANDGRFPRKRTREELAESKEKQLEQRLFKFVRLQREALSKGEREGFAKEGASNRPGLALGTHDETWLKNYEALRIFLTRSAESAVTYPHRKASDAAEKKLAVWVNSQRSVHKAGLLCEAREKKLYALSGWRWADHEHPWMDMYKRLQSWAERVGDLTELVDVPAGNLRGEKNVLAKWVQRQRDGYRRKNHCCLSAFQVYMLQEVEADKNCDFPFPTGDDLSWDEHYNVLQWWGTQFDGLPIPSESERAQGNDMKYDVDHPSCGWVKLGHFYYWSMRMIKLDDEGVPAEGRHHHRFFPAVLNGHQKHQILSWNASSYGEPVKRREKGEASAEIVQCD